MRFLKATIAHSLCFRKGPFTLTAYLDADWAGDIDDRRSTSGYAVFFGPNLISWNAKKQLTVSKSSTELEYRSLAIIAAELYWVRMLMRGLGLFLKHPPIVYCDNISAISLAPNPVFHARTKQVEVDYHFIREKVVRGDLQVRFVSSIDQLANIFTKGLSSARFMLLKNKLHVTDTPFRLRGDVRVGTQSNRLNPILVRMILSVL